MPKFNLYLNPGGQLPKRIRPILLDYFPEKDLEKLVKFGGRIQISLTAPFTDRKVQDSNFVIDDLLINYLRNNPANANENLKNLTKKQLTIVAKLLNCPINSKMTTKETKKIIIDFINFPNKWTKISGS